MTDRTQAQSTNTDNEKVLEEARKRMKECVDYWGDNHRLAVEDVDFRNGEQWPEKVKQERREQKRPCLVFNSMETFIDQVVGDQRQNKPALHVSPQNLGAIVLDNETNQEQKVPSLTPGEDGTPNQYTLAQIYEGLVRNIEYTSSSDNAYDTAFDNAVGSGFGYFRIATEYSDDSFDQDIKIKRILNQFSVYMDPNAEGVIREDSMYAFVYSWLTNDEFDALYGEGKRGADFWESADAEDRAIWANDKKVRVTEYFRKVPIKIKLLLMQDGEVVSLGADKETWDDQIAQLKLAGGVIMKDRVADSYRVEWYKLNGAEILETGEIPSKFIPIILVPGKELVVKGKVVYRSLIRNGKDAQRNYNYWRTAMTELVALAPKSPWTGGARAFEGYEKEWSQANVENYAYLPFNEDTTHRPKREIMGQVPQGALQEAQAADMDMKRTVGIHKSGLGEAQTQRSGRAIIAEQREGDTGTYAFIDNLGKSMEHAGRVIVDMIPQVYSNERVMRVRNLDGSEDFVRINMELPDGTKLYDICSQKFDVAVTVGPSYNTQREKAADMLTRVTEKRPELWNVIGDLIAKNMDWPGADEMARRLRKMIDPSLLSKDDNENGIPDEEEQPPTPAEEIALKELETKNREIDAKFAKAEADIAKAQADLAEAQAQLQEMPEQVQEAVAEAIAEFMQQAGGPPAPATQGTQLEPGDMTELGA